MPVKVERAIKSVMKSGKSEASAIRILKASGVIKQAGRHLAAGPKMKKGK